jgi:hypothetical protein
MLSLRYGTCFENSGCIGGSFGPEAMRAHTLFMYGLFDSEPSEGNNSHLSVVNGQWSPVIFFDQTQGMAICFL